jgi:hypothetical protein
MTTTEQLWLGIFLFVVCCIIGSAAVVALKLAGCEALRRPDCCRNDEDEVAEQYDTVAPAASHSQETASEDVELS